MILYSLNSRICVVNLFSDFILSKINKNANTIIQVIDCGNFFVVKGKTDAKEILNMSEVLEDFKTKFHKFIPEYIEGRKLSHTIDLIEYDVKLDPIDSITKTYYNSENCSYHPQQILGFNNNPDYSYQFNTFCKELNDESYLSFSSEFPYGYSYSQGRTLFYFGKYISYSLFSEYDIDRLTMTVSKKIEDFLISDDNLRNKVIEIFDFDTEWLETKLKEKELLSLDMIMNPLLEYPFLKNDLKELLPK